MASIIRSELFLTLLAGAVGGAVVAIPAYWGANRQMDVKMVEIAVGILAKEPESGVAPAREWAVDVIAEYSAVKPSDAVRQALVNFKAVSYYDTYTFYPDVPRPGQSGSNAGTPPSPN